MKCGTTSRYHGVYALASGMYKAFVHVDKRTKLVGPWLDELDAAIARDQIVLHFGLENERTLNFPRRKLEPETPEMLQRAADRERRQQRYGSRFFGVLPLAGRKGWFAWAAGHFLGQFETDEEAAIAYDRVARHLGIPARKWNFPDRKLTTATVDEIRKARSRERKKATSSKYRGVTWDRSAGAWKAVVRHQGRVMPLGHFADEKAAARHRDAAEFQLKGPRAKLNFGVPRRETKVRLPERRPAKPFAGVQPARNGTFKAVIYKGTTPLVVGRWSTEKAAALAHDRALLALGRGRKLNLPAEAKRVGPRSVAELRRDALLELRKQVATSRYLGVRRSDRNPRKWVASVFIKSKDTSLGEFRSEKDAAIARDRVWRYLRQSPTRLNFPDRELEPASVDEIRDELRRVFKETTSSRFRGVTWDKKSKVWVALIASRGTTHRLGVFTREEDGAHTYDRAAKRLHGRRAKLNFA
jgi:hypothetical protein